MIDLLLNAAHIEFPSALPSDESEEFDASLDTNEEHFKRRILRIVALIAKAKSTHDVEAILALHRTSYSLVKGAYLKHLMGEKFDNVREIRGLERLGDGEVGDRIRLIPSKDMPARVRVSLLYAMDIMHRCNVGYLNRIGAGIADQNVVFQFLAMEEFIHYSTLIADIELLQLAVICMAEGALDSRPVEFVFQLSDLLTSQADLLFTLAKHLGFLIAPPSQKLEEPPVRDPEVSEMAESHWKEFTERQSAEEDRG